MNINLTESADGSLGIITLSERNISHLLGASDIFNPAGQEPFLKRMCEDGTLLIVAVNDDLENPVFEKFGNIVTATVPPSTLQSLETVQQGAQLFPDAYRGEDGIFWTLVAQLDDEHYERREAGPGFQGII